MKRNVWCLDIRIRKAANFMHLWMKMNLWMWQKAASFDLKRVLKKNILAKSFKTKLRLYVTKTITIYFCNWIRRCHHVNITDNNSFKDKWCLHKFIFELKTYCILHIYEINLIHPNKENGKTPLSLLKLSLLFALYKSWQRNALCYDDCTY